jgi:hypothetical protein
MSESIDRLPAWDELAAARQAVDDFCRAAATSEAPIVIGPWLAEVGFEVLYWIPFVRRLVDRAGLAPERLIVVSRGGVESWYAGLCGRYVELFDTISVDEFREHTETLWERSGGRKQVALSDWERSILDVAAGPTWSDGLLLHPSVMYGLFRLWWRGALPVSHVADNIRLAALTVPRDPAVEALLPANYAAVRFYFRPSFPDRDENRALARDVIDALSESGPVVLLNTSLEIDDHLDLDHDAAAVIRLLDGVHPAANLHVQSIAIARARLFTGTYGGLSYLAPLYGVPCVAYASSTRQLNPTHMDLERRLLPTIGGSLTLLDARTRLLVEVLGRQGMSS